MLVDQRPTTQVDTGTPLPTHTIATQDKVQTLMAPLTIAALSHGHIWGIAKFVAFKDTQQKNIPPFVLFHSTTTKIPVLLHGNHRPTLPKLVPRLALHGFWIVGHPTTSQQIFKIWLTTYPTSALMML
uniref:Uncharacterized protein n=1 Tax=Populus alba TaxID=43335 RepID=A0A4U5QHV1_POPAL|nr:hypothetical protein D5086_0000085730 [Populus alba]